MIHVPDSKHAWDYFVIFNSTTELHGQSFGLLPETASRLGYFLRYPNNQFLGILFNQVFSPFAGSVELKMWVVTAVSALLTSLGVLAGTLSVKALSGKRHALLYNVCALGFLPFTFMVHNSIVIRLHFLLYPLVCCSLYMPLNHKK